MTAFIVSGMMGFLLYQVLAWANVPRGMSNFTVGGVSVEFTGRATAWARRTMRVLLGFLFLTGLLIFYQLVILSSDLLPRRDVAILLGFFWGPLFAIWINDVIANSPGDNLTRGQFVAGIGLALLFLLGSFGNETGQLLREYAKKVNNVKFAGAELSFAERVAKGSPGAGSVPEPGRPLISGSGGLQFIANLDVTITNDRDYLELFQRIELADIDAQLQKAVDDRQRQQLSDKLQSTKLQWEQTGTILQKGSDFAKLTVAKPLGCLVGWYDVTGDMLTINKHLSAFVDLFRTLQSIDAKKPAEVNARINKSALDIVRADLSIASDVIASVPNDQAFDKCDDLLWQICPNKPDDTGQPLIRRDSLKECVAATSKNVGASGDPTDPPPLYRDIAAGLTAFMDRDGIQRRPYFAVAYASLLAQLGQYAAAGAVLDGWLQRRSEHLTSSDWTLLEDWYKIRGRAMLAAYMEEWVRKEGPQPPTKVLDEHIANLDQVRRDLKKRLAAAPFFAGATSVQPEPNKIAVKKIEHCEPDTGDPLWKKVFDSYVTMELTSVQAVLLHPHYQDFSDEVTERVAKLASTNLSCIPQRVTANIYLAQILEAYARNVLLYLESRGKSLGDDKKADWLAAADMAARKGRSILQSNDVLRPDDAKPEKPDPAAPGFLKRIEASERTDTDEKLQSTLGRIGKEREALQ